MSPQPAYALLADGSAVCIRPAEPADLAAVQAMHEAMSAENTFLRFFSMSSLAAGHEARRLCREPAPGRAALLALSEDEIVGCASYEPMGDGKAEIAFAVADRMHHKGVGTLLLEHLVSCARDDGYTAFFAETLSENTPMLRVFADAGLPVQRHHAGGGIVELTMPLPSAHMDSALDAYLSAVDDRERAADAQSLRHLLAPASIAVIGADQRGGGPGRAIFENIRTGGYAGRLYPVHPHARHLSGVRCVPSVADLPEAPDLAVVAVPAAKIPAAAEACGVRGARALLVVTAGLDDGGMADLLAACRRHGMRLAGPDSRGIAVPGAGLDATLSARHPQPGSAGLMTQSGGLGLAIADQLSRLGVGLSSFVSVGAKLDVSGNDLLRWWEQDGVTRLAILCVDSFGNPRKFARTARRVAMTMPVIAVCPPRGASDEAAEAGRAVRQRALFEQAGTIAVADLAEMTEVAALVAAQPTPLGRRVAIVSNVAAASAGAADACADLGLTVHRPGGITRRRLRALVPAGGTVTDQVDLTAAVSQECFQRALELAGADEGVDAVIAIATPTAASADPVSAVLAAAVPGPLLMVRLGQTESVRVLHGAGDRRVPAYQCPESAVRALARAAAYGAWRVAPQGTVPAFSDVTPGPARTLVRGYLARVPGGGVLPPDEAAALLGCYGLELAPIAAEGATVSIHVTDDDAFGPLVSLGLNGDAATELGGDNARLVPLTSTDAESLIGPVRRVFPAGGQAGLDGLRDPLLRVARLAEDLPEVRELSLDPIVARAGGAVIGGVQVRVARFDSRDPFLRRLR